MLTFGLRTALPMTAETTFADRLKALRREERNSAVWGVLATHLLWIGALALVALRPDALPLWAAVALAIPVIGVMQYRLAMACHEAVHKTLLFPVALNEAVGMTSGALVALNLARYRKQHLAHHRAEAIAVDPDAYIYLPVLAAEPGLRRTCTWLFGVLVEIVEKVQQKGLAREAPADAPAGSGRHAAAIVVTQLILLVTLTAAIGWWAYPALWLAPLAGIAVMLNRTRVLIEHGVPHVLPPSVNPEQMAQQPLETVDIVSSPLERFVIAPYNFNYHYAHHRIQSIPHYNAPALAALLAEHEPEQTPPALERSYASLLAELLWTVPAHDPGEPRPAPAEDAVPAVV